MLEIKHIFLDVVQYICLTVWRLQKIRPYFSWGEGGIAGHDFMAPNGNLTFDLCNLHKLPLPFTHLCPMRIGVWFAHVTTQLRILQLFCHVFHGQLPDHLTSIEPFRVSIGGIRGLCALSLLQSCDPLKALITYELADHLLLVINQFFKSFLGMCTHCWIFMRSLHVTQLVVQSFVVCSHVIYQSSITLDLISGLFFR